MSTSAKTHTQQSNRVSNKKSNADRKEVFKSVLDNPFRIEWPSVPLHVQKALLEKLVTLFEGVPAFREQRNSCSRAKRTSHDPALIAAPIILNHVSLGSNQVTKHLDQMNKARRGTTIPSQNNPPSLGLVFVCRADVDPPLLIAHLPHSIAAFNSTKPECTVKLIPLPKGAEILLAEATGLRRVAVIGLDTSCPGIDEMMPFLDSIPTIAPSWMAHSFQSSPATILPTHIKQIKTSAPKNLRLTRVIKAEERRKARLKRRKAEVSGS